MNKMKFLVAGIALVAFAAVGCTSSNKTASNSSSKSSKTKASQTVITNGEDPNNPPSSTQMSKN